MKWILLLLMFFPWLTTAQTEGFHFQNSSRKEVIPFQLINNLILIPVTVNGAELTLLVDTGVAETLLFSLEEKEVQLYEVEKVKFSGLGGSLEIEGLKSVNNIVQIGRHYKDFGHTIYVILNEDFNFSSHVGVPVNGIIGYHFFKNHPVKIDYINKKITVYPPEKPPARERRISTAIPISLELNKPYLMAGIEQTTDRKKSKLLIDLGNSDPLWLFPGQIPGFNYSTPHIDDFLGRGFNGDIYGKRSRIHRFWLAHFKFEKPLMAMPDEASIQHLRLVPGRRGSVGNEILRRFALLIDYPQEKIYLRKNKNYDDAFHLNMSGLDIKHDGMFWDQDLVKVNNPTPREAQNASTVTVSNEFRYRFTLKPEYSVAGTRPGSPAHEAGVRKGDKIQRINGHKAADLKLEDIMSLMKSEEKTKITLEAERNGQLMKFIFYLEDPVPYKE